MSDIIMSSRSFDTAGREDPGWTWIAGKFRQNTRAISMTY
jgi:hypothetical protein